MLRLLCSILNRGLQMPRDMFSTPPHRLEGGSIDTEFYIRRVHKQRSEEMHDRVRHSGRALLRALHLNR